MLGSDCGGNFVYIENGIKDCSSCDIPHRKDFGYEYVQKKLRLYVESVKNM
jgi:Zn-finger protein